MNSNIGQRLKAVEKHLEGEQEYLANYSDGLTDLPLPQQLEHFRKQDKIASFLCVRPNLSYHMISVEEGNGSLVSGIHAINNGAVRINRGARRLGRQACVVDCRQNWQLHGESERRGLRIPQRTRERLTPSS